MIDYNMGKDGKQTVISMAAMVVATLLGGTLGACAACAMGFNPFI